MLLAILILCLLPLFRAAAQPADPECRTFECFRPQFDAAKARADGACPRWGSPDQPSVRNAAIPIASTPVKTIRLRFHVFANSDGSSPAATMATVDQLMADVNNHYRPWRIQFVHSARRVNDSQFRSLADAEESAMKSRYAESPASQHNVFVVNIEAGYNGVGTFPFDPTSLTAQGGTLMDDGAFAPGRTTLSHELGHGLGLWHTHHGVSEVGGCAACYESPRAEGGDMTGDFCSDTPPTPVSWACGNPGGTDGCSGRAWGTTDYLNLMSYSSCRSRFTPQQAGRMHAWIAERLTGWLVSAPTPTTLLLHVDWRYTGANPDGSPARPFPTVEQGYAQLATRGTVRIRAGGYLVRIPLNKPLLLEPYDGHVLLGGRVEDGFRPSGSLSGYAPPPTLSAPKWQADGSFALSFNGVAGKRYQVFTSTNLVTWEPWKDFTAESDTLDLVDPDAALTPARFFKVVMP